MNCVLMVHGITDNGQVFQKMRFFLERRGYKTYTVDLVPNTGIADLRDLAQQLKQYIDDNFQSQKKITLIGFSMGGLVTRYYLQRLNGMKKVDKYISISAPNYGTNLAYFLPLKGILQMRPNSSFLKELNKDVKKILNQVKLLTIWTPLDLMIFPSNSSIMGVGKEVAVSVLIHKWMLSDVRVLEEINHFLQEN